MELAALGPGWRAPIVSLISTLEPSMKVDEGSITAIGRWLDLLATWNRRMDLTAARSSSELVDLVLADAVVLVAETRKLGEQGGSWIDVGAGAGAPGLAIALLDAAVTMTLVEPNAKRVAFLRQVVGGFGSRRVNVSRQRAEQVEPASADIAVSRATFRASEWLARGISMARKIVWVLLAESEAPTVDAFRVVADRRYRWPETGAVRRAVAFARR